MATNAFGSDLLDPLTGATKIPTNQPTVQPNPTNPTSLQGTLAGQQQPPALVQAPAPTQTQAPSQTQPQMGAQTAGQPQLTTPTQSNPFALSQVIGIMQGQLDNNNQLVTAKNLVLKQLYGEPLTDAEKSQLSTQAPELKAALDSGDRNLIDYNLRLVNQQIAGRTNTVDQSIQYLTKGYADQQTQLETQRQDSQKIIEDALNRAGSAAFSNYPPEIKRQLEQAAGYPSGYLDYVPTSIAQSKITAQYGTAGATITIPGGTLAAQNNNPGNLRYVGQTGATQGVGGFAAFATPEAGYQALVDDIGLKMSGQSSNLIPDGPNAGQKLTPNSTLEDMIRIYAPTADGNDPVGYAKQVAAQVGATPQTPLSQLNAEDLAPAFAQKESSTQVTLPDIQLTAKGIIDGSIPPPISARGTITATPSNLKLEAAIAKQGGDLTQIALDWAAMQKWLTSANSTTQLRLRQAISSVQQGIEGLRSASADWNAGGFAPLNAANLKLALNGTYGQNAQAIAAKFQQQSTIITDELGQTFMGGNSPTDKALGLAGSVLNTSWSKQTLDEALTNLDTNLGYRLNAIETTGPIGAGGTTQNQYFQTQTQSPTTGGGDYQSYIDAINSAK